LSRIYGSKWSHKSNVIVIFRGAHAPSRACFGALAENMGYSQSDSNRASPRSRGRDHQHASRVCSPGMQRRNNSILLLPVANFAGSARYAFNFLPSPVMPTYCLLFGCAVTLSFTVAIAAQSTPATQSVLTARPIEAARKAVPVKVQKEAAAKTPALPKEPPITFNSVHVDGPYIAMTFDDGPSATLTPKLLDILAAHNIKATFFVLGEMVAEHPEILARAAREGHEIASHSWSHPNLAKMSQEGVRSQLQRTDDEIKSATGKRPTLFRPPYGSITEHEKKWIHDEFGYDIILWDVDPLDWKRPGPAVVRNRILKETRSGSIVLSHDIHPGTIEAMPSTFDELEGKGFKFVTVSELLGMATPVTPHPKAEPAEKTPAKAAAPSAVPTTSAGE
jgi:peptidoglycan/xylan/chitin deacetylase (PgdA/CDA1 family)